MNAQVWWYAARATGYVAWGLLSISLLGGMLVGGRLASGRPPAAWTLDLHRFVSATSVVFTVLHVGSLVADDYVHFGVADVLVPLASSWRPGAVALGVVALYLLAAIEITSRLGRRLPRRLWRSVHLSSYALFWVATFHLLAAGSDAGHPASRVAVAVVIALVVFVTLVRVLAGAHRRPARPSRVAVPQS